MDPGAAYLDPPWITPGQLDVIYRGMLNLPEPPSGANAADLLADTCYAGLSNVAELDNLGVQEALPPIIDFGVFQAAQQAEQRQSGEMSSLQSNSPAQAQPNEVSVSVTRPRSMRRSAQLQSVQRPPGTQPCAPSSFLSHSN